MIDNGQIWCKLSAFLMVYIHWRTPTFHLRQNSVWTSLLLHRGFTNCYMPNKFVNQRTPTPFIQNGEHSFPFMGHYSHHVCHHDHYRNLITIFIVKKTWRKAQKIGKSWKHNQVTAEKRSEEVALPAVIVSLSDSTVALHYYLLFTIYYLLLVTILNNVTPTPLWHCTRCSAVFNILLFTMYIFGICY